MAERDVVAKIKKYLTTVPDCFFWKEHGGMYGTAGIPDIIACIRGHFFGFEVKTVFKGAIKTFVKKRRRR